MGTNYNFTPEILATTATKVLAFLVLEVLVLKATLYFLPNAKLVPIPDLVAYCGYKFVGIVFSCFVRFLFGDTVFYIVFLTMSLFTALFMVKTFRLLVLTTNVYNYEQGDQRNYFLIFVAILQAVICLCFAFI